MTPAEARRALRRAAVGLDQDAAALLRLAEQPCSARLWDLAQGDLCEEAKTLRDSANSLRRAARSLERP